MKVLGVIFSAYSCLSLAYCAPTEGRNTSCASLAPPTIAGATLINSTATEVHDVTGSFEGSISICSLEAYLTHGDAGDEVRIVIWLPLNPDTPWNGRFQGTGGGGYYAGYFDAVLGPAVSRGYAAGCTDAGVGVTNAEPRGWAQDPQLNENFAHLSVHEMTLIGKSVTADFYGRSAKKSYFTGCSRGGQQGHVEAQKYPEDYDGILSVAAPVSWDKVGMAVFWPFMIQASGEGFISSCKLAAFLEATIEHCDSLDGAEDGLIANPPDCDFNPESLIGTQVASCGNGTESFITEYDASIWQGMKEGPRNGDGELTWFGLSDGASFQAQAVALPYTISSDWPTDFVLKDPDYDIETIDRDLFNDLWKQSIAEYSSLWGADSPDLSAFKKRGGKLLAWHGWADSFIPATGSPIYWEKVKSALGGTQTAIDDVYRLFMVPGEDHCLSGVYVPELGDLNTLVNWVEKKVAPDTLSKTVGEMNRNACKYPKQLQYKGTGDVQKAANWNCIEK